MLKKMMKMKTKLKEMRRIKREKKYRRRDLFLVVETIRKIIKRIIIKDSIINQNMVINK
jgi:hypothetical protein